MSKMKRHESHGSDLLNRPKRPKACDCLEASWSVVEVVEEAKKWEGEEEVGIGCRVDHTRVRD